MYQMVLLPDKSYLLNGLVLINLVLSSTAEGDVLKIIFKMSAGQENFAPFLHFFALFDLKGFVLSKCKTLTRHTIVKLESHDPN